MGSLAACSAAEVDGKSMERALEQTATADVSTLITSAESFLVGFSDFMTRPWTLYQVGIILTVALFSVLAGRFVENRLEPLIRKIVGRPRLLRFLALILRRSRWIVLALGLWVSVALIRTFTWPSRSYLVSIVASLVTAWIVIAVGSRLIRNRLLAKTVAYAAWIFVALQITGYYDIVVSGLDAAAVTAGNVRVSLLAIVQATVMLGVLLCLAIAAGNFADKRLNALPELTPTVRVLLGKLIRITLVVIAVVVALNAVGIDLTAFAVFSGALGIGIGFGLQKVVSNFISGIIILLDKSIKPGDTISLGDTFGWIRSLRARFVSVVTRDGREFLIPNEDFITQQVVNWSFTDQLIRLDVPFGVSYDSDPHEVRRLAAEAAGTIERVKDHPKAVCHLVAFGDSSLDFVLRFWVSDPQNGLTNVRGTVLLACWDAFKQAGIGIPFPHREIIMRTPVEIAKDAEPPATPA
jgi:small-conductance mechanosensitive channel